MQQLAQGIASLGRGEDTQLVHMTPGEVQGLQQLALSHGGSLTVNPHTGLVEAGFLSSLLSIGGGIVGGMFGGPMGAAAGSSLGSLVAGDDPQTALKHGLMSGVGGALFGSAADAASQVGTAVPVIDGTLEGTLAGAAEVANTGAKTAADELALAEVSPLGGKDVVAGLETVAAPPAAPPTTQAQMNIQDTRENYQSTPNKPGMFDKVTDYIKANPIKSGLGAYAAYSLLNKPPPVAGLQDKTGYSPQYTYDPKTQKYIAAAPMSYTYKGAEGGEVPGFNDGVYIPQSKDIRTDIHGSNAGPIGPSGRQMFKNDDKYAGLKAKIDKLSPTILSKISQDGTDSIAQGIAITELYDRANNPNPAYMAKPTMQAAQGGIMGMAGGGLFSDLTSQVTAMGPTEAKAAQYSYNPADQTYAQQAAAPQGSGGMFEGGGFLDLIRRAGILGPTDAKAKQYSYDPKGQSYAQNMAAGGIASLPNEYAAGGKLLQGPGDGMSDSIPAVIKGARPQRAALAQGEFVIPADVVSHLGNGSTDAGAKRLYAMMDKIRHARTGTEKQGRQINPANFMPA
jgi:hypothetical protein